MNTWNLLLVGMDTHWEFDSCVELECEHSSAPHLLIWAQVL